MRALCRYACHETPRTMNLRRANNIYKNHAHGDHRVCRPRIVAFAFVSHVDGE
jgi:hypothetical protein